MTSSTRRIVTALVVALVAIVALGSAVVAGGDSSSVTRPRLERSLPLVFDHLYADQAHLLGHDAVTPASLGARAMCDKHGPDVADVADVGPGGDWVCLMSWSDPDVPMPAEGYGKFELNVHSNDCYTVSGPSKLTGFLTITDAAGKEVPNPVFEFDGCFDPASSNESTEVLFPSLTSITTTTLSPDARGATAIQLSCGTGSAGCSGSIVATAGTQALGTVAYDLKEESTETLGVPGLVPADADSLTFEVRATTGAGPSGPVSLPILRP